MHQIVVHTHVGLPYISTPLPTGVDWSKILGGQTKILEGNMVKVINAWTFLNYWGHVPGLPPKSAPMSVHCIFTISVPGPFTIIAPVYIVKNIASYFRFKF